MGAGLTLVGGGFRGRRIGRAAVHVGSLWIPLPALKDLWVGSSRNSVYAFDSRSFIPGPVETRINALQQTRLSHRHLDKPRLVGIEPLATVRRPTKATVPRELQAVIPTPEQFPTFHRPGQSVTERTSAVRGGTRVDFGVYDEFLSLPDADYEPDRTTRRGSEDGCVDIAAHERAERKMMGGRGGYVLAQGSVDVFTRDNCPDWF